MLHKGYWSGTSRTIFRKYLVCTCGHIPRMPPFILTIQNLRALLSFFYARRHDPKALLHVERIPYASPYTLRTETCTVVSWQSISPSQLYKKCIVVAAFSSEFDYFAAPTRRICLLQCPTQGGGGGEDGARLVLPQPCACRIFADRSHTGYRGFYCHRR
jgi:hypothetical protein